MVNPSGHAHAVLLPGQRHRRAIDGQVHVVHHRAFFDVGRAMTRRAPNLVEHLLDHQLDMGARTLVTEHADVLQTHQRLEDLARVDGDEGASWFLAHTEIVECLRLISGDPQTGGTPLRSEDPDTFDTFEHDTFETLLNFYWARSGHEILAPQTERAKNSP